MPLKAKREINVKEKETKNDNAVNMLFDVRTLRKAKTFDRIISRHQPFRRDIATNAEVQSGLLIFNAALCSKQLCIRC